MSSKKSCICAKCKSHAEEWYGKIQVKLKDVDELYVRHEYICYKCYEALREFINNLPDKDLSSIEIFSRAMERFHMQEI